VSVALTTLTDQTLVIVPRFAGQRLHLDSVEYTAYLDNTPLRVQGPGTVMLGPGWWDEVTIVDGHYTGAPFHGDTPDHTEGALEYHYAWTGARNASTSTLTRTGHSGIAVEEGFQHAPFAGISVTGLALDEGSVITIWRSVPGEPRTVVQGARDMEVTAAAFIEDWGVPLGRKVTYTLEIVSGSVEPEVLTDTITIHSDTAWLQDPLNPVTAVPLDVTSDRGGVYLRSDAFSELARSLPGSIHYPMGSGLGASLGGQRRAPTGVPLTVVTNAAAQATRLRTLLQTSTTLMLRTTETIDQVEATTYWHVGLSEQPITTFNPAVRADITRWPLVGDQTRGPSVSVLVPRWTYGQVKELYSTYGQTIDGRRYLDWVRDPAALGSLTNATTMGDDT